MDTLGRIKHAAPEFQKRRRIHTLIMLLSSFFILSLCSKCSFLYRFNDWVDVNWFYTMGKGMFAGLVAYRDLFEQKGPLIYFLFGLCSLVARGSLAGVLLCETVGLFFYMRFAYRLAARYVSDSMALIVATASAILTATSFAFNQGGGSVEEYCLPLFMYGLYRFIVYFEDDKRLSGRELFIFGVFVGLIIWSKYSLALFFFVIMLLWLYDMLKVKKETKKAVTGLLCGALGVAAVTLPVLLYFAANNALSDLWECYFYNNIFRYSGKKTAFVQLLTATAFILADLLAAAIIAHGMLHYLKSGGRSRRAGANMLLLFLTVLIQMIASGYYSYYWLPMVSFLPLGLTALCEKIRRYILLKKSEPENRPKHRVFAAICLCAAALCYLCIFGNHTAELLDNDKYAQPRVAADIRRFGLDNPTLLCYKMQDMGFYRASEILPTTYYYALNNYSREEIPALYNAFEAYAEAGATDFIVAFKQTYQNEKDLHFSDYAVVGEYSYLYRKSPVYRHKATFVLLKRLRAQGHPETASEAAPAV